MERKLSISDLHRDALAIHKAAEDTEFVVATDLNHLDIFSVTVMRKHPNFQCEIVWSGKVEDVSKNLIDGFMLIGQAVGFIDGWNKAKECDFGPLEPVQQARAALKNAMEE